MSKEVVVGEAGNEPYLRLLFVRDLTHFRPLPERLVSMAIRKLNFYSLLCRFA